MTEKFYITTPIYYASDKPHIGHAFAILYADVIARYQKLQNRKVFFSTGTDEHGSKIKKKAQEVNKDLKEFVDEIVLSYQKTWQVLEIKYDIFIRTTSNQHKKGVLAFIERLYQNGDIYPAFYEGLYCLDCENFITQRELINGLCPNHLKTPQKIKEKNYFFRLEKYLPIIKEKILKDELKIIPEARKNEILNIIEKGVPDFSITREKVSWGIPFSYLENQTIYVWTEALINYLTSLEFPESKNFNFFWPPDLQIIGADITKFHAIFWPALLLAIKLPLPKTIFAHGLFMINGQKISKTIGNIIDPLDLVAKFGTDATRYLLLSQFPASEHGDLKVSEFETKYNSNLANGIGNLFERVITMVINYRKEILKKTEKIDEKIKNTGEQLEKRYKNHMENYELFYSLQDVFEFIKILDQYIENEKPWELNKVSSPRLNEVLSSLLWGLKKIERWLEPFMPSKIETIKKYFKKISELKKDNLKEFTKESLKKPLEERSRLNLFPRI